MAQSGQKVHSNRTYVLIRDRDTDQVADVIDGRLQIGTSPTEYTTTTRDESSALGATYVTVLAANANRAGYVLINYDSTNDVRFAEGTSVSGDDENLGYPLDAVGGIFDSRDHISSWKGEIVARSIAGTPVITVIELVY